MKNIDKIVETALTKPTTEAVQEAVSQLLGEDVSVGDSVALIDDDSIIGGYAGARGTVKNSLSNKGSGFVDVELENGTTVPCQSSLLIPLKK